MYCNEWYVCILLLETCYTLIMVGLCVSMVMSLPGLRHGGCYDPE